MSDTAYRVLTSFKTAVLADTAGLVADLNATVGDVDVYSATNTNKVRLIATTHSAKTAERINSLKPSRPVVEVVCIDLSRSWGTLQLQHILTRRPLAAVFWRLEKATDIARTVTLLAHSLTHDGIIYIYALDRARMKDCILTRDVGVFGDTVRVDEHTRTIPDFSIDDIDTACRAAGLSHIFDENLDSTADRLQMNILPRCRTLCCMHRVRAYQKGINLH